ncbi:MAG TPA: hypothetical protein VMX13_02055 [Sedimentisphaerales bacterium]|nr:hypothetical protein [Sedimentisphaerales bacterium]
MKERKGVPLKGKRYISQAVSYSMLKIAVGPEGRDVIATDGAIAHAMGSLVASLIARAILANIRFLRDQVDICYGEVSLERDFSVQKLEEHMHLLLDLNLLLSCLAPEPVSISAERLRFITNAFGKLPPPALSVYTIGINNAKDILEKEIISQIAELLRKISENPIASWEESVESLLREKVAQQLSCIRSLLDEILGSLYSIVGRIEDDWNKDLQQIRESGLIEPLTRKELEDDNKSKRKY